MQSVLVTGTSSGFGLHAATELGRRGWRVFATMRNLGRRGALDEAAAAAGVTERLEVTQLDVTDPASVEAGARDVLARAGGRLGAVVHNAGVAVGGAFEDVADAEQRRVMETNFWGVLALTRTLLPTFRAQRSGRILVVSSNSAYAGEPANSVYVASKWAIEGWAESLAFEVGPFGIDVVLVEPGSYKTEIWGASPRILPDGSPYATMMRHLEKVIDEKVLASARDPREVAAVIADALSARRPRFRYPVGPDAWVGHVVRGKLPTRVQRFLVSRLLGLHRVKP
ncbi:MAG: SDR family NAD(P)-dependent oxidoreductase [Deltaproteobacteria bacterium]|nr:SDR family NAD(P)-dependent oxidoreductase [Deltaproteobacteria bacterium]